MGKTEALTKLFLSNNSITRQLMEEIVRILSTQLSLCRSLIIKSFKTQWLTGLTQ